MFTENEKKLTKVLFKIKGKPYKKLYNYSRFNSPLNLKLSEGLLKHRSRIISRNLKKLKICRKCFSIKDIQYHHKDYKKPLDIEVLCRKCHMKLHKKIRKQM